MISYFDIASNTRDYIFHSILCSFFGISNISSISMVYRITFSNRWICCVPHINSKGSHKSASAGCNDENSLFHEHISSKCVLGWCNLAFQDFTRYCFEIILFDFLSIRYNIKLLNRNFFFFKQLHLIHLWQILYLLVPMLLRCTLFIRPYWQIQGLFQNWHLGKNKKR